MSTSQRSYDMETAPDFLGIKRRTLELWIKNKEVEPDFFEPTGKSRPKAMFTETTLRELKRRKNPDAETAAGTSTETLAESDAETAEVIAESVSVTNAGTEPQTGLARIDIPAFNGDLAAFVGIIAQAVTQSLPQAPKETIADLAAMPFLSFAQAARLFNVPEQHLRDAAKAGEIKAVKQGRGQQVRAKDVLAWRDAKFEE